jgi:hypothetical protein
MNLYYRGGGSNPQFGRAAGYQLPANFQFTKRFTIGCLNFDFSIFNYKRTTGNLG